MPRDTQSSRVTESINLLNTVDAQTLAQAQRAIKASLLPAIALQVRAQASSGVCEQTEATADSQTYYMTFKTV